MIKIKSSLKWIGFIAGIIVFFSFVFYFQVEGEDFSERISGKDFFSILGFSFLLGIGSALLSLYEKFWWITPFAIISLIFGGFSVLNSEMELVGLLMTISGLILFLLPFVNKTLSSKK